MAKICLKAMIQRLLRRNKWRADGARVQPRSLPSSEASPITRLPKDYQAAAQSLSDPALVKSPVHRDRVHRCRREGSHADIVTFYVKFQKELERRGMPFYAHCFFRSNEVQYELKRKGVSKAGPGASPHNYGLAVDIVHSHRHWELTSKQWEVVGHIGKEVARKANIAIEWGGDWNFYDPAHWQLKNWRDLRSVAPLSMKS